MKLVITPQNLAAAYDYLSETKPFVGWNLPPSEDIKFKVVRTRPKFAEAFHMKDGSIVIEFSQPMTRTTDTLMRTMAHEMIHVYEYYHRIKTASDHGASFMKMAEQVCAVHGFDPTVFN